MDMNAVIMYAAPLVVIGLTFALRPLRAWLEGCAKEATSQGELVESYQQSVAKFLKLSDPVRHAEAREIVVWAGRHMMDGTRLIQAMITRGRRRSDTDADIHGNVAAALKGLSPEALHAFSRALGTALLVSSYQSFLYGGAYRSMLLWVLNAPEREVKEPEQIVFRYRKATNEELGARKLVRA